MGATLLVAIFPQIGLGAFAPQLREDLGLTASDIGVLLAGLLGVGTLASPVAGAVVDRIGGRRTCTFLMVVTAAALLIAAVAPSRGLLLVAMLPAGFGMAFASPGTSLWAASAPELRHQSMLVGVAQAGVQAGALVAGLLAAAHAVGIDWRTSLRIVAGLAVLGAVLAARSPDDRRALVAATAPDVRFGEASVVAGDATGGDTGSNDAVDDDGRRRTATFADAEAVRRRGVHALAGYALLMGGAGAVVSAYLPMFAVDRVGTSVSRAGALTIVFGTTALVGRLALGMALRGDERRLRRLMVGAAVLTAAAIAIVAASDGRPALLWVGTAVFGASGMAWPALAFFGVVRLAPSGGSGRLAGWVTAAFYLGMWITPPVAGWAIERVGYPLVWTVDVALCLTALVPALAMPRPPAR